MIPDTGTSYYSHWSLHIEYFLPFELLYRCQPQGMLDLTKEGWEEQQVLAGSPFKHIMQLRKQLIVGNLARENLQKVQGKQASIYNQQAQERQFDMLFATYTTVSIKVPGAFQRAQHLPL